MLCIIYSSYRKPIQILQFNYAYFLLKKKKKIMLIWWLSNQKLHQGKFFFFLLWLYFFLLLLFWWFSFYNEMYLYVAFCLLLGHLLLVWMMQSLRRSNLISTSFYLYSVFVCIKSFGFTYNTDCDCSQE